MWYWILRAILRVYLKLGFRFKVKGLENLPKKSNFIIVSNHVSYLDAMLIMSAVPRKIHCIALRFLYRVFWIRWFLILIDALPIGAASPKAEELLLQNKNVGLFPEGGISHDGTLKPFRRGAALLALKTGRPILPCAVYGTFAALPVTASIPKLLPIQLKIGKPIYLLKEFEDKLSDIALQEGMMKVRSAIKGMCDAGF
jgi:1-acyl-sn-glycerol-3-phosphate acyltransferase